MKRNTTYATVVIALFAALICVATMLVRLPIPATGGYANLGDGVILICAFLMPPLDAVIAAGLGSALADVLAGYLSFAPGTLIIKAGVALIAALIFQRAAGKRAFVFMLAAGAAAEVFMVLAYFAYEALVLGVGPGAAGGIAGNIGQGVVGVIIACTVAPALRTSPGVKALMEGIRR